MFGIHNGVGSSLIHASIEPQLPRTGEAAAKNIGIKKPDMMMAFSRIL